MGHRLIGTMSQLIDDACAIAPSAMQLIRKPVLAAYILLTARRAQLFLVSAILVIVFIVAPLLDSGLRTTFPEKTSKRLFGLVKEKKQNLLRTKAYNWALFSIWLLATGETLLLVWMYIPRGRARAMDRARKLESRGDSRRFENPAESLKDYGRAIRLISDSDYESRLSDKIHALLSADPATQIASPRADDTYIDSTAGILTTSAGTSASPSSDGGTDAIGPGGRYTIEGELGRGGMGIVYKASDGVLDRTVALKKLPRALIDDEEYLARFKREAQTLARLTHPAILQIHDLFEDRRDVWMALEYIDGGDLADRISSHAPLDYSEAARLASIIAEGMAYAHERGTVHRDLKPGNILLDGSMQPKISDFGLAKLPVSNSLTQEGSILGSPRYMSPEQAAGEDVDHRTDIYSLGIILYEMITGRTPFEGDTSQILTKQITQPPPPIKSLNPGLPGDIDELIMSMLAKDVEARIQTMHEVSSRLAPWLSKEQPVVRPERPA